MPAVDRGLEDVMTRTKIGWSCLFLAACGLSEEDFRKEYVEKSCAASIACAEEATAVISFESEEDCVLFLSGLMAAGVAECDYDPKAAKGCLGDVEAAECDVTNSGALSGDCPSVYSGDACTWGTTTG
jgi:hypothetical protein